MKLFSIVTLLLTGVVTFAQKTENVVLITLDGMRWQEVFGGVDARVNSKAFGDSAAIVRDFSAGTPEARREKLMPFLWNTVSKQGQVYGNRGRNSFANVTNKQWFSYPGYSEILCGFADDERINSNDKFENPNTNVLEFINTQPAFVGKVAAYSSWDVFPYIINTRRSKVPVNSGIVPAQGKLTEKEKILNELMYEVPNPLGDVRLDAFTFHYAFEYMKSKKPRVMFISFDETDDFAHGGKYELYLRAAHYTDTFIKTLWDWCQSNDQYRNKTTFIITCDHGRGDSTKDDWRSHGIKVPHADQIWMAIMGPDTAPTGEQQNSQIYQNQIAKTISTLLKLDYKQEKAGKAIAGAIK
jgi:hypothetical protein